MTAAVRAAKIPQPVNDPKQCSLCGCLMDGLLWLAQPNEVAEWCRGSCACHDERFCAALWEAAA